LREHAHEDGTEPKERRGTALTDTDREGLSDGDEVDHHSTNAIDSDTDGVGPLDGVNVPDWYLYFLDGHGNISCSPGTKRPSP
jgi:hypothetical protein